MTFKSKIRIWKKLKAEHGHRILVGSYAYTDADQTVEVRSLSGQRRATQLGGSTPETLARLMLIELADEEKARFGALSKGKRHGVGRTRG